VSSVAWSPNRDLDTHEWVTAGRRIGAVCRSVQWLLGDWIAYGNSRFGERYSRAARITGYDVQTLMNMVYVASRYPVSRRRENLSWSHHEALAALDPDEQERWLDEAGEQKWSVTDLRMMLRMARKEARAGIESGDDRGAAGESQPRVRCPRCGEEIPID
jgi:hypothetical protein